MATDPAITNTVSRKAGSIDALKPVYDLVQHDFAAVNALIPDKLTSDVGLVEEIGSYIVESGGKRLRPLMVLLTTGALEYEGQKHISLAAIIEFLHTATLLHDDVVDHSGMRRGKLTANEKWGNAPSVLVGDFLYSRAFQLMVEVGSLDIMAVLASATNTIAEGEVLQLTNVGNVTVTEQQYREVIRCKTALLFEAATHSGAILAQQASPPNTNTTAATESLRKYGLHFGMSYQLVDDWLDYAGDSTTMGKNVGDDLAEGKLTLPLIEALRRAKETEKNVIRRAIERKDTQQLPEIIEIVLRCGALEYTHQAAVREAELALACIESLPPSPYLDALQTVTQYSSARLF